MDVLHPEASETHNIDSQLSQCQKPIKELKKNPSSSLKNIDTVNRGLERFTISHAPRLNLLNNTSNTCKNSSSFHPVQVKNPPICNNCSGYILFYSSKSTSFQTPVIESFTNFENIIDKEAQCTCTKSHSSESIKSFQKLMGIVTPFEKSSINSKEKNQAKNASNLVHAKPLIRRSFSLSRMSRLIPYKDVENSENDILETSSKVVPISTVEATNDSISNKKFNEAANLKAKSLQALQSKKSNLFSDPPFSRHRRLQSEPISNHFISIARVSLDNRNLSQASATPNPIWLEKALSSKTKEWLNTEKLTTDKQKLKRHTISVCFKTPPNDKPIPLSSFKSSLEKLTGPIFSSIREEAKMPTSTQSKQSILLTQAEDSSVSACTVERLLELMTSPGSDELVTDFFLSYRLFLSPLKLCELIESRFLWALNGITSFHRVARVRTFVIVRHWVNFYYDYDFANSNELKGTLGGFLDRSGSHPSVVNSEPDLRIVRQMRRCLRHQSEFYSLSSSKTKCTLAQNHLSQIDNSFRPKSSMPSMERDFNFSLQQDNSTTSLSSEQLIQDFPLLGLRGNLISHLISEPFQEVGDQKYPSYETDNEDSYIECMHSEELHRRNFSTIDSFGCEYEGWSEDSDASRLTYNERIALKKNHSSSKSVQKFLTRLHARALSIRPMSIKLKPRVNKQAKLRVHHTIQVIPTLSLPTLPDSPTRSKSQSNAKDVYINQIPREVNGQAHHHLFRHFAGGFILKYPPELIARQFCIVEQRLLAEVTWDELVFWGSDSSGGKRVGSVIDRFNLTCQWVASVILSCRRIEDRVNVIERIIHIAWWCHFHRNFSSLLQLILGLQCSAVSRLEKTWAHVSSINLKLLDTLLPYSVPLRNWSHMRRATEKVLSFTGPGLPLASTSSLAIGLVSSSPIMTIPPQSMDVNTCPEHCGSIPFLGLYLSDLVFNAEIASKIKDTAVSELSHHSNSPIINFSKFQRIATIVRRIWLFQGLASSGYSSFEPHAQLYPSCFFLPCLSPKQIHQLSLACET